MEFPYKSRIWGRFDAAVNNVPCKVVLYEADFDGNIIIKVTADRPDDFRNQQVFNELSRVVMDWCKQRKREAKPVFEKSVEVVSSE